MIITLIPYCPRSEGKNLGFAYNELMGRLRDEDWACFLDHDACFTTPDWYAQLEEITAGLTEPCVLTALTNRVGSPWQLAPGVDRDNHSMDYHRRIGRAIQAAAPGVLRDVTHESLMSGVVILLSRRTWLHLGGFVDGFLGVDNAIHQAARDRGGRIYLMAGVYVYHWYRADAFEARDESHSLWGRVPVTGRRILLIGHDVDSAVDEVAARRPAALSVVAMEESALERTRQRLGDVPRVDDEGHGVDFADGSFDAILAADLLERVRRPGRILRRLRRWLAPGGRLITAFRTARSLAVVDGLLAGRWWADGSPAEGRRPLRVFTRREVEKLFYRAGFVMDSVAALPGPGHAEWVAQGQPGHVRIGRLAIAGLPAQDAEEFHARGFLVEATAPAVPDAGLTSIIIVTLNQLEYTRQCVESVRRLTDEPYELIFVDNGSADGTIAYLESIAGAKLIRNAENRGFPAAVNQGIAAAAGAQVLLLNNDTIVTTGWLRRLLAALCGDAKIGLAGPCSNFVGSEQQVEASYDSPAGLDGFAWEWGKAHDRELVDTHRLIGFCLLIRHAVVEAIGLLDERFGIGCYEDDDYCLRAIRAGWRAVIARDAFIHHYGGRTFLGSGADLAAILRENGRRFREKWRSPAPALPRVAGAEPAPPASPQGIGHWGHRPAGDDPSHTSKSFAVELARGGGLLLRREPVRLSLCMIVRDSAGTLRPCLESIRPWVDEMIVVDTGSTDETPRIVEELGGRLYHFPWCDDFSAARNESLRLARGEWLFWMDSDDTIPPECGRQLRALIDRAAEPGVLGYVMQVHCPGGSTDGDPDSDVTVVDHVKLIRNRPDLRFEGRIHEQVLLAIRRAGGTVAWTELYVVHSGSDLSPEAQDRKRRRDLHLLHLELREQPEHPFTLFNLGMTYADAGRFEEAEEFLKQSIRHSNPDESHLRKAYALLVYAEMRLGRREAALATCRRGRELFPEDAELRFREGVLLHELGRLEEAVQSYRAVLANHEERHFSSIDRGLTGFKARQNLAVVYTDLGDLERAEAEWREVTRAVPRYRPGWRGLGEVLIRATRLREAMAVAEHCLGEPDAAVRVEGRLLKGRLAVAAGDIAAARAEIEQALAEDPGDRAALEARCHLLFDHGPPAEAEAALRALIDRDPEDPSAHHNLGMLLLRLKRYDPAARAFRQALRHRADAPATYLHLGYALKECGRLAEAVAAWQQVLRLAPDDAAAGEELARASAVGRAAPPDRILRVRS
jgi:GT2 family glycosyltransferase/tetratricopeptide (TPR) repeat protein